MHARLLNIQDITDDQKDKISSCISDAFYRRSGLAFLGSMSGLLSDEFRPRSVFKNLFELLNAEDLPINQLIPVSDAISHHEIYSFLGSNCPRLSMGDIPPSS